MDHIDKKLKQDGYTPKNIFLTGGAGKLLYDNSTSVIIIEIEVHVLNR